MNAPDPIAAAESPQALAALNRWLDRLSAHQRIAWALECLSGPHALSTSFGVQSAVSLHLLTQVKPDIPVILVDTGYLFADTYRYADTLHERFGLNLHVLRPLLGSSWMEARVGKLWEDGIEGLQRYNQLHKVEPMQRALRELDVRCWFAGLRRMQSPSRASTDILELRDGRWKLHPIADWDDLDIAAYAMQHDLPEHPLSRQGYVSVGDVHTTRPLRPGMDKAQARFFGLTRECGLHIGNETSAAA
ncbi:phosphoadenylyl-sulfate reductase [Thermomonas sp.]|uniref:phosphoadenylyl-sulfate reductase n=1 Tax=Thermomonas sp. TaxID=1971895 RepID=UPI0024896E46|nr:phosphoadenylyl-sulfate reductase [Thermomonas sp.]MDI1251911.1 phosphoadenylyl-sulfate reductase [Thermomonas sp.]